MDISNLAPMLGKLFGVQPSTLVLLIMVITTVANAGARRIPADATGFLGGLRKVCSIIGVYVQNRVTSGVTVTDVAKAALDTQPITAKVDAAVDVSGPGEKDIELIVRRVLESSAGDPNSETSKVLRRP